MKFLISFISIDTTIPDDLWANRSALSCVCHEYVTTDTSDFQECSNLRDIEAAFEANKNYAEDGDSLLCPQAIIKVIRIEPVPDTA